MEKLIKFRGDAKETWSIMKELIGKVIIKKSLLPFKILTDKTEILGETNIANEFNNFFTDIGLVNLLSKFQNHQKLLKVI